MKRLQTDDDGFSMRITKSQSKGRLGFGKEKERRKEASGKERSLEASLNTQKGNGIDKIPILPLSLITGYYILPSL